MPTKTYNTKQVTCATGLSHGKIHDYPNDCILFRKEHELLTECCQRSASHYQESWKSPKKTLWNCPIIPRFKLLYSNAHYVKLLRWHADKRIQDSMIRYPVDSME